MRKGSCLPLALLALAILSAAARAEPAAEAAAPVVIDLARALALAAQNSPELQAAKSDVGVATAALDRAAAGHWPTVRAQAGWTEFRRNQRLYPATTPGDPALISHHILGGDVLLSLPLYSGGRISGNVDAAELAADAARARSQWTRTDLVYRVTASYFAILAQRQLIAALTSSEAAVAQNITRLAALVVERKAAPLDRQRLEVRLAALKQRRAQDEAALKVQTLTLLSLIGISGRGTPIEVTGELEMPSTLPPHSLERRVQDALARRADHRASQAIVRAQERRVAVARAGHLPQLLVQGSYGLRWGLWPSEQPEGTSAVADVGQLGLYLDLPIFEGGAVTAEVREQQARLGTLREQLRLAELQVRLEVEAAVLDLRSAIERVTLSRATIDQASEAFRIEAEKHAVGKSTISEVLSAQSDLLDAEASRARALADANIAAAALKRALGKDA